MKDSLEQIAEALKGAQRIGIAAHVRPDGDAIGSVMGLALSLKAMGKTVYPILEDEVPGNLAFLPEVQSILRPKGEVLELDVAVALDTASHERLGANVIMAFSAAPLQIDIDHHQSNPGYGALNHIDVGSPATGQIVYELLSGHGFPITAAIREHLFAAISTDTGSFQYSATTPRTHTIVAEMMAAGLDTAELSKSLYQTYSIRRLALMRAMLNEMQVSANGRVASWQLTERTMEETGMQPGDTEGLIDVLRMIDTVVGAVIFEEMADGKVRASARSKDARLDVASVCAQFGGGGHRMAAGARLKGPITEAAERFLKVLEHEVERFA